MKINCWEHKKCGREPGGDNVNEFGVCVAVINADYDGAHGGDKAGRACWAVAGTLCEGKIQGTCATKLRNCSNCDFYNRVILEEGKDILSIRELLVMRK